ncbi:UDP-N-acetylmuramoyl-tripeptide--D-alanyl-D-alanine ligase [Lachnospiraceae bacterium MD1]|uniref:UDP-N-acetylmuramoyl-tripeptide--D-alanyl-D-alanine ligase n=1 Tax=Variimorphobacter saccharofermentans TaxID=2755051 RepID=A0A839JZV7_9FIRM|nr:UDP-N-acetylmuramoyl-tripeptide--D-alanyl-D-alanine ligase [Variimorphobacter saccharofermentans]MBB2183213.1 UDP-N-acetylmuramoyl-tripeptide--D-alanyl-D-alanine ligase [Variimorphobacter saccharofermentans]
MKNMSLRQIADACGGQLYNAEDSLTKEATGVVMDSRLVEQDYIFIATVGERVDGHSFIQQVYEKGALAVICEKVPSEITGPYILVQNSFEALKAIAKWYRMQLDIKVIGITGSVGKTSTKEFISSVLAQKYNVLKTEGNYNNEVGMPLTILKLREEHELAVLEMGISDFGEMHRLSEIAKPDFCVITNIGQCHLENLGSRKGILKAKSEIFDFMNKQGHICLNGDDDMLATIEDVNGIKPVRFGLGIENTVYATDVKSKGLFGSTCIIHTDSSTFQAEIPLPGDHMILNALAATCVGRILQLSDEQIAAGIASVPSVSGRSNILRLNKITIIDDCYNANPVSMKAAIDLLKLAYTRKVAILGDMFELGKNEVNLHYEIGTYAALSGIDVLICVGSLSENMFQSAQNANSIKELLYFKTRDELMNELPKLLHNNDTILVKASHSMGFERIVTQLTELGQS